MKSGQAGNVILNTLWFLGHSHYINIGAKNVIERTTDSEITGNLLFTVKKKN